MAPDPEKYDVDKIAELMAKDEANAAYYTKLLPAWFISRMMNDSWSFGLLLVTGHVLAVETITAVRQDAAGNLWLDLDLEQGEPSWIGPKGLKLITSPTSRTKCTVNAAHVVWAFERADT